MRSTSLLVFVASTLALAATGCGNGNNTRTDAGTGMDAQRPDGAPACTTGAEDNAAACNDACDNDDDTFVDCEDRGCCALRADCPATSYCGSVGDAGPPRDAQPAMACATAAPEDTIDACMNGCDDEPDGFADCDDFDCCDLVTCGADTACGRAAMRDAGTPIMRCDGGGAVENTAELCGNGTDDDCDGFADCEDYGCCSRVTCGATTACGMRPDSGPRPDAGPPMVCDGGMAAEDTPAACMDGCSNDGDRFVDCEERDCCTVRTDCPATSYCGAM